MLRTADQILSERARLSPKLEAIVDLGCDRRFTYQELEDRSNALAHILRDQGVEKGDRVALLMSNGHVFLESYYAIAKLGAIAVLLNWRLTVSELDYIVKDCSASALMYTQELTELADALKPKSPAVHLWLKGGSALEQLIASSPKRRVESEISSDDPLFIMYTSGTTGKPKGAVLTHKASVAWHQAAIATSDFNYGERLYTVAPMFHIGALAVATLGIYRGMTNVIDRMFDPDGVWKVIEQERINSTFLVPAMLNFMAKHKDAWTYDCRALRGVLCGGSPVPVSLIQLYAKHGIGIHQVYGATENHGGLCMISPDDALRKAGSTGRPYFGMDVRVVNELGDDVQPGVPGEVIARGDHILKEYWNKPDETKNAFKDGWFYLGDIAELDEEGFIYIKDRSKDMIISGGENVYPAEVEDVIMSLDGVVEAAVIGQPSVKWGESVCAIVVTKQHFDDLETWTSKIRAHCIEHLASYKRPRVIEFAQEIPRNSTGKALKVVLRETYPGPAPE